MRFMTFIRTTEPVILCYYIVAILATIAFVLQCVLVFIPVDKYLKIPQKFRLQLHTKGVFKPISYQNLVLVLLGLGWTGVFLA